MTSGAGNNPLAIEATIENSAAAGGFRVDVPIDLTNGFRLTGSTVLTATAGAAPFFVASTGSHKIIRWREDAAATDILVYRGILPATYDYESDDLSLLLCLRAGTTNGVDENSNLAVQTQMRWWRPGEAGIGTGQTAALLNAYRASGAALSGSSDRDWTVRTLSDTGNLVPQRVLAAPVDAAAADMQGFYWYRFDLGLWDGKGASQVGKFRGATAASREGNRMHPFTPFQLEVGPNELTGGTMLVDLAAAVLRMRVNASYRDPNARWGSNAR